MQSGMTAVSVSAHRDESGMQAGMFPISEGSYLYHHRFIPRAYRNATRSDSSSCSRVVGITGNLQTQSSTDRLVVSSTSGRVGPVPAIDFVGFPSSRIVVAGGIMYIP